MSLRKPAGPTFGPRPTYQHPSIEVMVRRRAERIGHRYVGLDGEHLRAAVARLVGMGCEPEAPRLEFPAVAEALSVLQGRP